MVRLNEIRVGEMVVEAPSPTDAGLVFIGRIHTPWTDRLGCPRQGRPDGPTCRIEVLYWLHLSRRDLVRQSPRNDGIARGTFSLRTPVRPNPIGTQLVMLVGVEAGNVFVRGLDCLDDTPLIDLKPDRCAFTPLAPRQPGDEQVGDAPLGQ